MDELHFIRPLCLLLLLPLAGLWWWLNRPRWQQSAWARHCDAALLPHILEPHASATRNRLRYPLAGALTLAVIAMSGPTWEQIPVPLSRTLSGLVIAVDLSRSMDAADVHPSRLARIRFKIADILNARKEGQTALLAYSSQAFVVSPLTDDAANLLVQLPALHSDIMPVGGSDAGVAIVKAQQLLAQSGLTRGDILLLTDGTDAPAKAAAQDAWRAGYRVSVLAVGTPAGAPVPLSEGRFATDSGGNTLLHKLDEKPLQQIVNAGNGIYLTLQEDDADIQKLHALFAPDALQTQTESTQLSSVKWHDAGYWLVLFLLPLAATAFRRGTVWLLLLVLGLPLLPASGSAMAAESIPQKPWWLTDDQYASRLLQQNQAHAAAEYFENYRWKSSAHYRAEQYREALESLGQPETADDHYNRGNYLARLGEYQEALQAYQQSLKLHPAHADAKYNYDLVQKLIPPQDGQGGGQGQSQNPQSGQQQNQNQQGGGESASENQAADERQRQQNQPASQQQAQADQDGQSASNSPSPTPSDQQQEQQQSQQQQRKITAEPQPAQQAEDASGQQPLASQSETNQQLDEQWLRQVPDDPGGLLRRKFLMQQRRQEQEGQITRQAELPAW